MDVLARLATEEPDLSGVPGELSELITACMHRVPRQRPTSTAMLVQLGDFTVAQAGPDEEHSYLPDKVMALIAEYQRSPQIGPLGEFADERGDATSASYTELPASYKPVPRRKPGHGRTGTGSGSGAAGGSGWRRWLRGHLAWAGWASVGAALVVVGVILGSALSSSSSPSTASNPGPPGPPPAPTTVCGSSGHAGGGPDACMVRQSRGPADAAWVVRASGFEPGKPVTVTLTFNSPPQVVPAQKFTRTVHITPSAGTFQLNINQLFPGVVQLGLFDVQVTGSGGREATTHFIVIPPGGP
jgi:hypothetical protein